MNNTIFIKEYTDADLPINEREIWRYSGYMGLPEADDKLLEVFEQIKRELVDAFSYKVCYIRLPLEWEKVDTTIDNEFVSIDVPELPFETTSRELATCLTGSHEIVLFAATIGLEIDRHIARCGRFAPAKALLMQGFGAERVENLCNAFCREIQGSLPPGEMCTARFSPGYGDLPLETQREFFRLLDCNRKVGISLNDSLLMTPSKSVTAIFGIKSGEKQFETCTRENVHNCSNCNLVECDYRQ